jgi:predicted alpha/beta-fold hydrolase
LTEYRYRPAWWLRNAHAQTMWGRFLRRIPRVRMERELLAAHDGDSLELWQVAALRTGPRVLLLHGLEGGVHSHYVGGLLAQAHMRGWGATLIVFRGCGSAPNRTRRFYHSGETTDLALVFDTLRRRWPDDSWMLAGVSLGGNVLLKWLGEQGAAIDAKVRAAAAVSVPYDLEAGARKISRGFARVYDRSFLRSLRRKAMAKLSIHPDLFDRAQLARARNIYQFDDAVTAPIHGFADAHDYYERSSSLQFLRDIRVPTLLLSSLDDPFLPRDVLSRVSAAAAQNAALRAEFHPRGGHVGFVAGSPWRPFYYAEWRVFAFFDEFVQASK